MKIMMLTAAMLALAVAPAFAQVEGDHESRPRPEYFQLQQEILTVGDDEGEPGTTDFGKKGFENLDESAGPWGAEFGNVQGTGAGDGAAGGSGAGAGSGSGGSGSGSCGR
jgi:hypothetical protein